MTSATGGSTDKRTLPEHVAIILDGHRRYAEQKNIELRESYARGADKSKRVLRWVLKRDIDELTYYVFSDKNFRRQSQEVRPIFELFETVLNDVVDSEQFDIQFLGNIEKFPVDVDEYSGTKRQVGEQSELSINVAIGYSGQDELLKAAKKILRKVESGRIEPEEISPTTITDHLYETYVSTVDLMIRTSGVTRTSGFMPWKAVGGRAVFHVSEVYFPEFDEADFERALRTYDRLSRPESKQVSP